MQTKNRYINAQFKFLWFLMVSYTMVLAFSNWFDLRLVSVFGITTDAGTLIFPLSFLLSDLITEVYGYKNARKAIWTGFLFNGIFLLYGFIVSHMPSPSYPTYNVFFDKILSFNIRIISASTVSYLVSEPLNSFILAKLKIKLRGKYMGMRFIASTFVASGVDSFIFGMIAFFGVIENLHFLDLIVAMWLIKVLIEIVGLPISVFLAKKIKKIENIDIYDSETSFSIFSLKSDYKVNENAY